MAKSVFGWCTVFFILIMYACKHEVLTPSSNNNGNPTPNPNPNTGPSCSADTVYFQQTILPILVSNCAVAGCHDATTREEGYVFTDYANVMKVVRPGRPDDSDLYEVITETDPDKRMPYKRTPLTAAQISSIEKWIRQGAKNNSCVSACDSSSVTFAGSIQPILQTNCLGCHSGTAAAGNINFSTHAGVKAQIDNGKLWAAINHTGPKPMPQGGTKLSTCNINKFGIWIRNGAPNN